MIEGLLSPLLVALMASRQLRYHVNRANIDACIRSYLGTPGHTNYGHHVPASGSEGFRSVAICASVSADEGCTYTDASVDDKLWKALWTQARAERAAAERREKAKKRQKLNPGGCIMAAKLGSMIMTREF